MPWATVLICVKFGQSFNRNGCLILPRRLEYCLRRREPWHGRRIVATNGGHTEEEFAITSSGHQFAERSCNGTSTSIAVEERGCNLGGVRRSSTPAACLNSLIKTAAIALSRLRRRQREH